MNPLYGVFLINQLGIADRAERIQAMESVLELPGSVAHFVRVPRQDELPPGPAGHDAAGRATAAARAWPRPRNWSRSRARSRIRPRRTFDEEPVCVLTLAEKLRRLFDYRFSRACTICGPPPVWAAGEVLQFGGDFNKYVTSKQPQKQEGMVFRHLLRLILLIAEFAQTHAARDDRGGVARRVGRHRQPPGRLLPRGRPDEHGEDPGRSGGGGEWCGRQRGLMTRLLTTEGTEEMEPRMDADERRLGS